MFQPLPPTFVSAAAAGGTPVDAPTELDSGSTSALQSSFSTASVAASTDKLLVIAVLTGQGGARTHDSVAGYGLTWTKGLDINAAPAGFQMRLSLWYALGTPSPTTDTVDVTMSGNCRSTIYWLGEIGNVETTAGGGGAWDTTDTDTHNSDAAADTDLVSVASGALHLNFFAVGASSASETITADSDFTQTNLLEVAADNMQLGIYYDESAAVTACNHTLTSGAGHISMSVEILGA